MPETYRVGLLGHGTVGAAFEALLAERADAIAHITGFKPEISGVLTRSRGDFAEILSGSDLIVELIGGIEPARDYVLDAMRAGKHVVSANKLLLASYGEELWSVARANGVQLRFEGAVAGVVPVIRVLQESLAGAHVERIHGIVNGTTNFILTEMARAGATYESALHRAQELGYAEADPTDDVSGGDAAAKLAILATVAFGSRVPLEWVEVEGIEGVVPEHVQAARALDMKVKLLARATLADGRVDARVGPAFVDVHHPLAAVEGPFNAVMLQGDAIREITLEGPGAGGIETASAVVADLVSIVGTSGTGFLQDDPVWRELERLPPGELASPWYLRLTVDDRAGVLERLAHELAAEGVSVARLVQQPVDGHATLHVVTHEAPAGRVERALAAIRALPESRGDADAIPVVSERGVEELGWA